MKLSEVKNILNCIVVNGEDKLEMNVKIGCATDLMSDVLAFSKAGSLLLTGLANVQSVRTADIADVSAIVYVRGKKPDSEALKLAKEKDMPLLSTGLMMFEACGKLYHAGLPAKLDNE